TPAALLKDLVRIHSAIDTMTSQEMLAGLALAVGEKPPEPKRRPAATETAPLQPPPPSLRRKGRRGEPDNEPILTGRHFGGREVPWLWVALGGVIAVGLGVAGVLVALRESGSTPDPIYRITPQTALSENSTDNGRAPEPIISHPSDTPKGP